MLRKFRVRTYNVISHRYNCSVYADLCVVILVESINPRRSWNLEDCVIR